MILWLLTILLALNTPSPLAQAQPSTSLAPARFTWVDVYVDPHGKALAAYQFEFVASSKDVEIVGIEGGASVAFSKPPYYDPAALQKQHRVILAALSTEDKLPSDKTRVARIHLRIADDAKPDYQTKLSVAATSDGKSIAADVSIEQGVRP
jgi:hypothetical protein